MRRISLFLTFVVVLLASSIVLAEGPKEDKGVQKESKEQGRQVRTRTVTTRDPKTAKPTTKKTVSPDEKVIVVTKDPKTGEMVKRKISVKELEEMKAKSKEKKAKAEKEVVKTGEKKAEEAKGQEKVKTKSKEAGAQVKGQEKKAFSLEKQLAHEEQKHQRRRVRLERMLQVAKDKGDDKAVGRIEKLMVKEQGRYDKKHQKMQGRGEKKKK